MQGKGVKKPGGRGLWRNFVWRCPPLCRGRVCRNPCGESVCPPFCAWGQVEVSQTVGKTLSVLLSSRAGLEYQVYCGDGRESDCAAPSAFQHQTGRKQVKTQKRLLPPAYV